MLVPLLEFFLNSGDYERRLGWEPGHAESPLTSGCSSCSTTGAGRPRRRSTGIVSNRGYYAGGITLMLAAVALLSAAERHPRRGRRASARFALAVVLGVEPIFSVVTALPGFRTAHNGRMVIFVLFALALLAGWGLDDLSRRDAPTPPAAQLAIGAAAAIFCVPFAGCWRPGAIDPAGSDRHSRWHGASPTRRRRRPGAARDADVLRAAGDAGCRRQRWRRSG